MRWIRKGGDNLKMVYLTNKLRMPPAVIERTDDARTMLRLKVSLIWRVALKELFSRGVNTQLEIRKLLLKQTYALQLAHYIKR